MSKSVHIPKSRVIRKGKAFLNKLPIAKSAGFCTLCKDPHSNLKECLE